MLWSSHEFRLDLLAWTDSLVVEDSPEAHICSLYTTDIVTLKTESEICEIKVAG